MTHEATAVLREAKKLEKEFFSFKSQLQDIKLTDLTKDQYHELVTTAQIIKAHSEWLNGLLDLQEIRRAFYE